jgi:hypothetical protein
MAFKMKKRHILIIIFLGIFIGIPLILHLSWRLTDPRELNVISVNKSLMNLADLQNIGYNWAIKHMRYVDREDKTFQAARNHLGFIPMPSKKYQIRDFSNSNYSMGKIQNADVLYFADNYGIYSHDWYKSTYHSMPYYKMYGGLSREDISKINFMLDNQKAVIAEFNFFSPPTSEDIRRKAEDILGVRWQGWTGRFIASLNAADSHLLPSWLIKLYNEQNPEGWKFKNPGIIFINNENKIVVLEYQRHLKGPAPQVSTYDPHRRAFSLPKTVPFPGWFEINRAHSSDVEVISWFEIPVNAEGEKILSKHGIPSRFPAAMMNQSNGRFYYFAGDFGKTQIPERFSRLKGARYLELLMTDLNDPAIPKAFFFSYYLPLASSIYKMEQRRNLHQNSL